MQLKRTDTKKISLVIFDMDGLMFDTERLSISAWQEAGREFHYEISKDAVVRTIGFNTRDTELILKQIYGPDFPFQEIKEKKIANLLAYIRKHGIPVKAGLYELIDFLKSKAVPMAVATSSPSAWVRDYLAAAGLLDAFSVIVSGDQVGRGKPAPDIFFKAAESLGVPARECLVLEDSANGIRAATDAGMIPVLVPDILKISKPVQKLACKVFHSLSQVRKFIEKNPSIRRDE